MNQQQQQQQQQQRKHTGIAQAANNVTTAEAANAVRSLPKIRVVVRQRPLNGGERQRGEEDVVRVERTREAMVLTETKLKVDLTKYTERNEFSFDAILDDDTDNDEVYLQTVAPLVSSIFRKGRSTCFAYGQTGSGKTYTMSPLPTRAVADILSTMRRPENTGLTLWMSNFEIYGGKVFDLLNDRQKLCMREDGRQRVCIVGLQEFEVENVEQVEQLIELGQSTRSTGTTGANAESSRSHAIIQLVLRSAARQQQEGRFVGKTIGKFSFIDLAGNERGADTYDNDKQTRLEGAEINKSLLALKECIRALDMGANHIPFRGSKLTEVLRDSFMGDEARTVMIACISPSSGSCENTLNTLRYANRVKELRKSGTGGGIQSASASSLPSSSFVASGAVTSTTATPSLMGAPYPSGTASVSMVRPHSSSSPTRPTGMDISRAKHVADDSGIKQQQQQQQQQQQLHHGVSTAAASIARPLRPRANSWTPHKVEEETQPSQRRTSQPRRRPKWTLGPEAPQHTDDNVIERNGASSSPPPSLPRASSHVSSANGNGGSAAAPMVSCADDRSPHRLKAPSQADAPRADEVFMAHRKHIEAMMESIREEMGLLASVDVPAPDVPAYLAKMGQLLSRRAASTAELQERMRELGVSMRRRDDTSL